MPDLEAEARLLRGPWRYPGALVVGSGDGRLGLALKALARERQVFGIEKNAELAAVTARDLDGFFPVDPNVADPPLAPGSIDAIVIGGALVALIDPEVVLRRLRRFRVPGRRPPGARSQRPSSCRTGCPRRRRGTAGRKCPIAAPGATIHSAHRSKALPRYRICARPGRLRGQPDAARATQSHSSASQPLGTLHPP